MTKTQYQIVEMLGRVVAFGEANQSKFPKTSLVWLALEAIRSAIAKGYELVALQRSGVVRQAREARQSHRDTLVTILDAIHQTSIAVAIDVPQADALFWLPPSPRRDGDLIEAGKRFAKHAEPLKTEFVEHHLRRTSSRC